MGSRPSLLSLSLSLSPSLSLTHTHSERRRQRSVWRGKAAVARPCRRGKSRRVADTEPLHMEVGCRLPAEEALGRG
ncbi:hypothetical protein GQ55_6G161400 [Panicum hallii var. hallii]|uniref:Uncharacterized protein n=1 Tax=Panicum hallii var. hallii TaxID=1504633 RepID=A0A2T7D6I6_9POAL|nr:hypothetical protein GQ55_6G161400 [Panicum hallii var. hallii]